MAGERRIALSGLHSIVGSRQTADQEKSQVAYWKGLSGVDLMRHIRPGGTSRHRPFTDQLPSMNSSFRMQQNSPSVTLYTRVGCHLCDDARRVLEEHGLEPTCVDIDADPELHERFDACVPVIEIEGRVRFRGRIEPVLLRRLLTHYANDGK
jgi:glutaredoxin